ncbi:MAG: hypothetical protein RLZZ196_297 [Bacteroidota bacterium]|jgi:hypothetical protein
MADVKQPIDVKPEVPGIEKASVGFNVRNITPAVYLTGEYNSKPEAKAVELTRLVKGLLANGIWSYAADAAKAGVPAGTFIIVDNPETKEKEFTVEIVPFIRKK